MIGKKLGRYQIKEELGRGGMANVYVAADPQFGRDVAVKVLPTYFLHEPLFQQRFEREARTLASLEHHAIVPVYDYGQDESPYLVMRLMKGGTLRQRLAAGPLPVGEIISILHRVGDALDTAHARGIVHRDVKSDNILFDEYGKAYLTDFGIVKLAQATTVFTQTGRIIGTSAYMSPEQARGDMDVDGRSDIYSLGIVLYEMFTGQVPFQGETPLSLLMKHLTEPVPEVNRDNPKLPSGYSAVVSRALAKNKEDRYPTVAALVADLEAVATGRKTAAALAATAIESLEAVDDSQTAMDTASPVVAQSATTASTAPVATQPRSTGIRSGESHSPPPPPVMSAGSSAAAGQPPAQSRNWLPWVGLGVGAVAALIILFFIFRPNGGNGDNLTATPPPTSVEDGAAVLAANMTATEAAVGTLGAAATQAVIDSTATQQAVDATLAAESLTATAAAIPTETPTATPTPTGGGGRVLFDSDRDGNREIYTMNIDGSNPVRLTADSAVDGDPEWSPDGSQIVFASDRGGDFNIYVMNADGSEITQLTDAIGRDWTPTWSPDGTKIAFASERDGNFEIYLMNADGSEETRLTNSQRFKSFPAWSPDGQQIVYSGALSPQVRELFVLSLDSLESVQLTADGTLNQAPAWSPDGSKIAFSRNIESDSHIFVMNADGTEQVQLTSGTGVNTFPGWSPDSTQLLYVSTLGESTDILQIALLGSEPINLSNNPSNDTFPYWWGE